MKQPKSIKIKNIETSEKLKCLQRIYNKNTNTKILDELLTLELNRLWINYIEYNLNYHLKNLVFENLDVKEIIKSYEYLINSEERPENWLETIKEMVYNDILAENLNIDIEAAYVQEALVFLDDFYLEKEILKLNKLKK